MKWVSFICHICQALSNWSQAGVNGLGLRPVFNRIYDEIFF